MKNYATITLGRMWGNTTIQRENGMEFLNHPSFIKEVKPYLTLALNTLITSTFLVVFIFLNWGVDQIIKNFNLSGIDRWALLVFQWLFTGSSIVLVGSYVVQTSVVACMKAWRSIRQAISYSRRR
jgi:hypothetical protein